MPRNKIVADIEKMAERNLFSEEIMVVCETDKSVELPEEIRLLRHLEGKNIWD